VGGLVDGIRAEKDGNIWVGAGWVGPGYDGVHIFTPSGERIGIFLLPEICATLCFGGTKRNRLFMADCESLYALYMEAQGRISAKECGAGGIRIVSRAPTTLVR